MPSRLLHSRIGPALAGAAVLLLAAATASAQGYVEFRPTTAAGSPAAGAVTVRLLPTVADATATVWAYGYILGEQAQYLYVGLAIANNGDQPLAVVPGSCAWTDDLGRRSSGASLFSGQTPLASATVAAGGRDDLQLGFAAPQGAPLAEIRSITVDVALTYAGRPYTAQVQFSKAALGQVPAPPAQPSALVGAVPGAAPVAAQPVPVQAYVPQSQALAPADNAMPWWINPNYSNPYVLINEPAYVGWDNSFYSGWWNGGPWSLGWGGWTIFVGDDFLFRHHRPHHGDGDDDGPPWRRDRDFSSAPARTPVATDPSARFGWKTLGPASVTAPTAVRMPATTAAPATVVNPSPTVRSRDDASVTTPRYTPPTAVPPSAILRATSGPASSAPAPAAVRSMPHVAPAWSAPPPSFTTPAPSFRTPAPSITPRLPDIRVPLPTINIPAPRTPQFSTPNLDPGPGPGRGRP